MPEIKNTTAAEAVDHALARLEAAREQAVRDIARAYADGAEALRTRQSAVSELSGLIERAKHAYVKDSTPYSPTKLVNVRVDGNNGLSVVFAEAHGGAEYDRAPTLTVRPYRFWLLIEELPLPEPTDAGR